MDAYLIVVEGAKAGKVRLRLPTMIGRGVDADVKVRNSLISRRHCEVYEFEGELAVRDLGSSNGTFVNAERITQPTFLGPGDELQVGTIVMRAAYQPQIPAEESTNDTAEPSRAEPTSEGPPMGAPIGASAAAAEDTRHDVMDERPIQAESAAAAGAISSVVRYRETDHGSFICIEELGEAPRYDNPSHSQIASLTGDDSLPLDNPSPSKIAGLAGDSPASSDEKAEVFEFHGETKSKPKVESDDSALSDFLNDLEE